MQNFGEEGDDNTNCKNSNNNDTNSGDAVLRVTESEDEDDHLENQNLLRTEGMVMAVRFSALFTFFSSMCS